MKTIVRTQAIKKDLIDFIDYIRNFTLVVNSLGAKDYVGIRQKNFKFKSCKPSKKPYKVYAFPEIDVDNIVVDKKAIAKPFDIKFIFDNDKQQKAFMERCGWLQVCRIQCEKKSKKKFDVLIDGQIPIEGCWYWLSRNNQDKIYNRLAFKLFDGSTCFENIDKVSLRRIVKIFTNKTLCS